MAGDLDISTFNPFNKTEHYHNLTNQDCDGHWDEQWYKENCRIWGMPDLNHENSFVNKTIIDWLTKMLKDYGFDGVRYADVVNAPTWFWNNLTYAVDGMYTLGIFDNQNITYVASYQQYMDGVADFPLFYQLRSSFCDGSMLNLDNYIKTGHSQYTSPQYNAILFDIHDAERFLYQCSLGYRTKSLRNLVVFTFFFKGIPIFYYGDEQYLDSGGNFDKRRQPLFGNYDEESDLYQLIKTVNQVRKNYNIFDLDLTTKYVDADNYVYMRGKDIMIAVGKGLTRTIEIEDHGLNDDDKFCNKLKAGDCISVKDDILTIRMDGEPKIYLRKSVGEMIYVSSYLFLFLILLALF
jgi:alpha-amylase